MKKLLLFFLIVSKSTLFAQTVLNSYPLELNNPLEIGQVLSTEDLKTHDIFVFAADDKKINILKYNDSFFLKNQFTDTLRIEENKSLLGHSISDDGNPTLYFGSKNLRNMRIVKYFLDTKTSRALNFNSPVGNEYTITSFQLNNSFYILAKESDAPHLLLYEFQNGKCEIKMFDLSTFIFQNEKGQNFNFSVLLKYFPIQKIETNDFNGLDKSTKIIKMYVLENSILLSFDHNAKKTQILELNLKTTEVTEKNFEQPVLQSPTRNANSFYSKNKLFQIKTNKDEFLFNVKDYTTGKTLKTISISKNDTINFKNSPMFLQVNNEKPQKIKTTAKFLKQLSALTAGISVLEQENVSFLTFGGFKETIYTSLFIPSKEYMTFEDFENPISQAYAQSRMVFFDAVINSNNDFINNQQQEPLALDNILYYLSTNSNASLQNTIKLKDYSILTYYDTALKQLFIRKFTDGFIREDNGNPIMNKLQFSKPASFGSIKSR